jgi:hypothetical protein
MIEFVKATKEHLKDYKFEGEVKIESIEDNRAITLMDSKGKVFKIADGCYNGIDIFIEKPLEKKVKYEVVGKLLGGMIEYKEVVNEEYDANKLKNEIESKDTLADIKINKVDIYE